MRRTVSVLVFLVALGLCAVPGGTASRADAQEVHVLRIATLAPRGTPLVRLFQEWDKLLRKESNNRVQLRIYAGGSAGDEKVVVRKMRANQIDGAAITTTGLGMLVRPVLVLSAPGVILDYKELDAVRSELAPEFDAMFEKSGYELLSWGDSGLTRLFSQSPIKRPKDLQAVRPWVWQDNPVFVEFLKAVGANGVPLGVPEVYSGLQTGMIDTVVTSALGAVALQWFTRLKYVSNESSGVVVGALVLRKDKLDALPPELAALVRESSKRDADELRDGGRQLDDKAYRSLLTRGIKAIDVGNHRREWEEIGKVTRDRLAGRLYSKELLDRVETIAARARRN